MMFARAIAPTAARSSTREVSRGGTSRIRTVRSAAANSRQEDHAYSRRAPGSWRQRGGYGDASTVDTEDAYQPAIVPSTSAHAPPPPADRTTTASSETTGSQIWSV